MRIFQKGFNFSQDGPGNRLVYHLSGCNMRCIWCSNPEGMRADAGIDYALEELLDECIRSRMLFFSGGGVTFTGGEATVQYEELSRLLKMLKKAGIHTAIETNGTSAHLQELLEDIDYLMMDFKHYDSDILKRYTGVGNEQVKYNFEENCRKKRKQHIRIPLIRHINSEHPEEFAKYFSAFDTQNTVFEFLPYHEYGKEKWVDTYQVKDGFITEAQQKEFEAIFKQYGLQIVRT